MGQTGASGANGQASQIEIAICLCGALRMYIRACRAAQWRVWGFEGSTWDFDVGDVVAFVRSPTPGSKPILLYNAKTSKAQMQFQRFRNENAKLVYRAELRFFYYELRSVCPPVLCFCPYCLGFSLSCFCFFCVCVSFCLLASFVANVKSGLSRAR